MGAGWGSAASQSIDVARQVSHMNVTSAVTQYCRDREYALADLVVCGSEFDTDLACCRRQRQQRTAIASGEDLQAVLGGSGAHLVLREITL